MKLELTIDAPKGWLRRLSLFVALPAVVIGVAAMPARAGFAADTSWMAAGKEISSSKLKALFDETDARLTRVEARSHGSSSISGGSVFCGATSVTAGDLSDLAFGKGYHAAKNACAAAADCKGSKTAHLCSGDEVVRSAQIGITMPNGWMSTGILGGYPQVVTSTSGGSTSYAAGAELNDCNGFTARASSSTGRILQGQAWQGTVGALELAVCDSKRALLCCD